MLCIVLHVDKLLTIKQGKHMCSAFRHKETYVDSGVLQLFPYAHLPCTTLLARSSVCYQKKRKMLQENISVTHFTNNS